MPAGGHLVDRQKLERAVVAAIAGGADRFATICAVIAIDPKGSDSDDFRRVDAAIQAMRKAGRIALIGKPRRWVVLTPEAP